MSLRAMVWAFDQDVPPGAKLVLLALADHAHDDGSNAFPSKERIARKTGYSERQVQRIMSELRRLGALTVQRAATRYTPTVYLLPIEEMLVFEKGDYSPNSAPSLLRAQLLERDDRTCRHCGGIGDEVFGPDGNKWEADRVVAGDVYTLEACVLSCRDCNARKGGREAPTPMVRKTRQDDVPDTNYPRGAVRAIRGDARGTPGETRVTSEPSVNRQRTKRSSRRSGENGEHPPPARIHGSETAVARHLQRAAQGDPGPDSSLGLAREFGRRAEERDLVGPGDLQDTALARNISGWLKKGDTPGDVRQLIDDFLASRGARQGNTPLWQRFTRDAYGLRHSRREREPVDYGKGGNAVEFRGFG